MTFVAGAVLWSAYTLAWWGWEALTDRVPPGQPNTVWWPSIRDLVLPARIGYAVPAKLTPGDSNQKTGDSTGTNAAAGTVLGSSTAPPPTVGTGAGDTGNITAGLSAKKP